jgi:hypothetical protein
MLRLLERSGPRKVFGSKRKEVRGDYVFMMRNFMVFSRLKVSLG